MKKQLSLLLSGLLLASSLVACGAKGSTASTTAATSEKETAAESTTAKEEESKAEEASSDGSDFKAQILFCGSTSLYPIMSSLASSFTEKYETWDKVDASFPKENISIYVAPGGSGVGVKAAVDGTADFGMLARDIKDKEVESLGKDYKSFEVAKDALTVSVSSKNPNADKLENLDTETLQKIFDGEYTKWNQVDSALSDDEIHVYIRDLSGGAYEVFQKAVMGDKEITPSATQSASMTELATNVANDPNGIGYVGFGAFNKANKESTVLKEIKVDGVEASEEKILSGDYKIQRPVMFVTGKAITKNEQAFIDYVFSETGYDAVVANGYIPAFTK